MIVLDTNVLSEVFKPSPSVEVLRWLAAQEPLTVFTTAITEAEILYGVEALPAGRRRAQLAGVVEKTFLEDFHDRILPFDEAAARAFGKIMAGRKAAGRPISQFDGMIAAIARSRRGTVATRNTADFERCGIGVVNPWTALRGTVG